MKIRTDFVTNSSSSSFIVLFSKKINTYEELKHEMFANAKDDKIIEQYDNADTVQNIVNQVLSDMKKPCTKKELLEQIESYIHSVHYHLTEEPHPMQAFINAMLGKDKKNSELLDEFIDKEEIKKIPHDSDSIFKSKYGKSYYLDIYHNESVSEEEKKKLGNEYHKMCSQISSKLDKISKSVAHKVWAKYKGKLFIFHYSDNDGGFGCLMEHGNIFRNVPHVTISHH